MRTFDIILVSTNFMFYVHKIRNLRSITESENMNFSTVRKTIIRQGLRTDDSQCKLT